MRCSDVNEKDYYILIDWFYDDKEKEKALK